MCYLFTTKVAVWGRGDRRQADSGVHAPAGSEGRIKISLTTAQSATNTNTGLEIRTNYPDIEHGPGQFITRAVTM